MSVHQLYSIPGPNISYANNGFVLHNMSSSKVIVTRGDLRANLNALP
jgi:hypothetical protein